jgi:UDP-N-acetylmuramoylalanine--D-glutamate ligase
MIEKLRSQKVAVVGMGKNNQKLAEFLRKNRIAFDPIQDWKNADELIGKLDHYDVIFRTPGLPYLSQAIQQAKSAGVEISSQTKLFFELCPAPIIGITGTKGKGTTSSLIAKILQAAGKKTWLGGNIGTDPFEFLDDIDPSGIVVLELSSFQLQDLDQSPTIAVVLSVTPDHLNHHQSFEEYMQAKSNILSHQSPSEFAVLHSTLPDWFKQSGAGKKIWIEPAEVRDYERKLLGEHNLDNIDAAKKVAEILNIDESVIRKTVAEFEPLPHRLNPLRQVNGIAYIDDAFSTNVDPTIAAINSMTAPFVLIVGGHDKGLDFTKVGSAILASENLKGLVVIGEVTDKILVASQGFKGKILTGAQNMTEILDQAKSLAQPGDAILFSPGTSSFDMFKNEFDRGQQFVDLVNKSS